MPAGMGDTCAPSTPFVSQATSPAGVPPVPSGLGSNAMLTTSTCASAQVMAPSEPSANPPPLANASQLTSAVAKVGCESGKLTRTLVSALSATLTCMFGSQYAGCAPRTPTRSTLCVPGESGEMDVPSTPPELHATSTLPAWSRISAPSTLMRTDVTPACAQLSPPKVQFSEIDPPGTLWTSIRSTLSPRWTTMSCCVWYRTTPPASRPEMVRVYRPAKNVPRFAPPAMAPPPWSQENWLGVSSSCAMSTWMVWTPAARHVLPANVQSTSRLPRAGSPHPDP